MALSRELGEFLIELAIALQKHAIYPEGHPSLEAVADGVVRRLGALLRDRSALSLGVARRQLVIEGIATDAEHPVLQQLAGRLHAHHLGAVRFKPGVTADELVMAFRALAVEPDRRDAEPLGLLPEAELPTWPHIKLYPMSLDQLQLVEEEERDDTRSARLWIELARAALATDEDDGVPTDPAVIAGAIERRPASSAYDQVIVGYLLEIARELRSGESAESRSLRTRIHGLVDELTPETLRRLVRMGGDLTQQRRFMLDANAALNADAVVKLLEATADASSRPLSDSLLRILSKLSLHARQTDALAHDAADGELRSVVSRMLEGWELDDPNPTAYGFALAGLARTRETSTAAGRPGDAAEPERMLQMCLEADAVGAALERAIDMLVDELRVTDVLDALERAPTNQAANEVWKMLAVPERLAVVIRQPDLRSERIAPLIERLGLEAQTLLLDALCESDDRSSRRAAFDLLTRMGTDVLPAVDARLEDDRWFVLRNLLAVHNALGTAPGGAAERRLLSHEDPRVRREAVKIGLRAPAHRSEVLRTALGDPDERVLQYGLVAALDGVPENTIPLVLARAKDGELKDTIRSAAIRVLGRVDQPVALRTLLELAAEGKGLLGGLKLARPGPATLAAVAALAEGWSEHPEAAPVLARARSSRDPAMREAAQGKVRL